MREIISPLGTRPRHVDSGLRCKQQSSDTQCSVAQKQARLQVQRRGGSEGSDCDLGVWCSPKRSRSCSASPRCGYGDLRKFVEFLVCPALDAMGCFIGLPLSLPSELYASCGGSRQHVAGPHRWQHTAHEITALSRAQKGRWLPLYLMSLYLSQGLRRYWR